MPAETSSVFVDKQCASAGAGMQFGFMEIMTGLSKCVLSAGVEHLTRVPMGINNKWINPNLTVANKKSKWYRPEYDVMTATNMLQTAQKLYEEEVPTFTKEDMDQLGVRAHNLTVKSHEEGCSANPGCDSPDGIFHVSVYRKI